MFHCAWPQKHIDLYAKGKHNVSNVKLQHKHNKYKLGECACCCTWQFLRLVVNLFLHFYILIVYV